jgi:MSHA biogenesis protein MshN
MSLINQMLADLERRGALSATEAAAFQLRPVPSPRRARASPLLAVAAAVVFAAIWLGTAGSPGKHPPESAPAPEVALPVAPVSRVPPQGAADDGPGDAPELSLRLSSLLPGPEPRTASRPRAPTPARPAREAVAERPPLPPAADGAAQSLPAFPAEKPAAAAAIDKRVRQPTPRERAEMEFSRAVNLMQQGRAGESIESLKSVLQLHPPHESARQVLAALLVEGRRIGEAEEVLEEGVRQNPGSPRLALALARIQVERGGWEAALDTLRQSEPAAAEDADYRGFMGSVLQRMSRHAEAIPHYVAAVNLAPQSGLWYMGLGISLEAEGRIADARESYQRARATQSLKPELLAFVEQRLAQLAAGR